jgi:hypothetical protein
MRDSHANMPLIHGNVRDEFRYVLSIEKQAIKLCFREAGLIFRGAHGCPRSRVRLARVFSHLGDGLCPILGSFSAGVVLIGLISLISVVN